MTPGLKQYTSFALSVIVFVYVGNTVKSHTVIINYYKFYNYLPCQTEDDILLFKPIFLRDVQRSLTGPEFMSTYSYNG